MILARRAATRHRFSDSSRGDPVPRSVTSESPPSSSSVRNTRSAFHKSSCTLTLSNRGLNWDRLGGCAAERTGLLLISGRYQPDDQSGGLSVRQAFMRQRPPGLEGDGV